VAVEVGVAVNVGVVVRVGVAVEVGVLVGVVVRVAVGGLPTTMNPEVPVIVASTVSVLVIL
jgi:hypothetical protein